MTVETCKCEPAVPTQNRPNAARACRKCAKVILGGRDPVFEREFLRQAERMAGFDLGWAEEVADRLHDMERKKGPDSYLELGLHRATQELGEEGLDLGGWAITNSLMSFRDLADDERGERFRLLAQEVASLGPRVKWLTDQMLNLLAE